jgi:hypothetical protein
MLRDDWNDLQFNRDCFIVLSDNTKDKKLSRSDVNNYEMIED